jgi:hypothetical protein
MSNEGRVGSQKSFILNPNNELFVTTLIWSITGAHPTVKIINNNDDDDDDTSRNFDI